MKVSKSNAHHYAVSVASLSGSGSKTSSGGAQQTTTTADTSAPKGGNGLSKSDIIAIVSCVVGLPGAIIAIMTLARCDW